MLGSGMSRILVSTACLCYIRHSRATRGEWGWGMLAEASDEERMLRYRLDGEVVNLPQWLILAMSRTTWLKEIPCSAEPSRIMAVKEQ
jgi:hypothetical protein